MNNSQKLIKIGAIILAIFIIVNIVSLIFSGLSWLFGFNLNNNQNNYDFSEEYRNVKEIEIDGVVSSIEIVSGSKFIVEANNLDNKLITQLRNGILKIEEKGNIFSNSTKNGKIYITVPKDVTLDELSIDTGAGKFIIQDITAKEFDLDHGAGTLELEDVHFYSADIDGGAGKIEIKNAILNDLELDAGAGKVEVVANITGNSQINCGVGEVDITLLGNEDNYQITTEKGIGSIKINGITQKNGTIFGNGSNKLEIEGGIGNIDISFK